MTTSSALSWEIGSSPLVRGQQTHLLETKVSSRIIPARAGPTCVFPFLERLDQDHPRSCGANNGSMNSGVKSSGSSPLVRGQLGEVFGHIVGDRIIPARAGPTRAKSARIPIPSDHPRSCGANRFVRASFFIIRGSSPLVRGQLIGRAHLRHGLRIIPARAGPTTYNGSGFYAPSDHPRSCGANGQVRVHFNDAFGSSPLVRGQRSRRSTWTASGRIIPARAGPTRWRW